MELSLHERIQNAASSIQVENVKARHSYYHATAPGLKEYDTIWTHRPDTTWGHGDGRMNGIDSVKMYQVNMFDFKAYTNYIDLVQVYPKEVGGLDPHPLLEISMHLLATDIVEVAKDGQSARSMYLTPGMLFSWLCPEKEIWGACLWERYGTDYLLEDGEWKIHHDQVCPDFMFDLDVKSNWARKMYKYMTEDSFPDGVPNNRWGVSEPGTIHRMYTPVQPPQDTVPWPEPYDTFDFENNYATIPVDPVNAQML